MPQCSGRKKFELVQVKLHNVFAREQSWSGSLHSPDNESRKCPDERDDAATLSRENGKCDVCSETARREHHSRCKDTVLHSTFSNE